MPKVEVTDSKGLVQSAGAGLNISNLTSLVFGSETKTENADALSVTIPVSILGHDGDEAVSLANGTAVGQTKIIISNTDNTVTCTPATLLGASTTIATTNIGEVYVLVWSGAAGWAVVSRSSGASAAAGAIAGAPVLA